MSYYAGRREEHLEKHEALRYADELASVAISSSDTTLPTIMSLLPLRISSRRISRELEQRRRQRRGRRLVKYEFLLNKSQWYTEW